MTTSTEQQAFEIARLQILSIAFNNKNMIYEGDIYAWYHRVYPYFSSEEQLNKNFSNCFNVTSYIVEKTAKFLDKTEGNNTKTTFYNLEDYLQKEGYEDRFAIICACRYIFLKNPNIISFWDEFCKSTGAPVEAHHINNKFDINDFKLF